MEKQKMSRARRSVPLALAGVLALASRAGCAGDDSPQGKLAWEGETAPALSEVDVPSTADEHGGIPVSAGGVGVVGEGDVIVDIYLEPLCPPCGYFEGETSEAFQAITQEPGVTVVYHMVEFLDARATALNHHSSRVGAALAVVADQAPEHYQAFLAAVYENQPQAGSPAVTDERLIDIAQEVGVPTEVAAAFTTVDANGYRSFVPFVAATTAQANVDLNGELGTPTILVNKTQQNWQDPASIFAAIEAAQG